MICPQCKTDNIQADKFCTHCGASLADIHSGEMPSVQYSPLGIFTDQELKMLLEINRKAVSGDDKTASVNQSDIDKLFE
jgi:hypothetical protein